MLKAKALRERSLEELEGELASITKDLFRLANQLRASRKLDQPHLVKAKKKDRARLLTILTEKRRKGVN